MQKTTRLQRLLAVIVAVFMAVCCLPLNAFAADGGDDASTNSLLKIEVRFHFNGDGVPAEENLYVAHLDMPHSFGEKYFVKDVVGDNVPTGYVLADESQTFKLSDGDIWCGKDVTVDVVLKEQPPVEEKQTANYNIKYFDENGNSIEEPATLNVTWMSNETAPSLMGSLRNEGLIKDINGFTYVYVCAAGGSEENKYDENGSAVVVPRGPYELEVHYTTNAPTIYEANYTINFFDEKGNTIREATTFRTDWFEGKTSYLLTELQSTLQNVDEKYTFDKVYYSGSETPISETNLVAKGDYVLNAYYTTKEEPSQSREAVYTVNFVDENGDKIKEPVTVDMSWVDGQELFVLTQLDGILKNVEGYTFKSLTAYNGTEPYDGDELVVEGNFELTAHYTKIDLSRDTTYKINFVDQNGNVIRDPAVVTIGWVEGQDLYVLAQLESTLNGVEGNYSFDKLTAWDGTEAITDTVKVVPGSYELTAHYILGGKDCNSKYTIHFVDENNNEFMDPAVVNMAWVEGQELNLMTQLKSTLDSVSAKGYTFKTLTAWNGTEAYKGDELVVPGEYELIAHCVKNTSGSTGDDSSDKNNNSNKTVSSSNNNQVVKADAPADNTAKVMPQTGLTAETPVVFGVMMVAALAGAGAYLFAIRKKLN